MLLAAQITLIPKLSTAYRTLQRPKYSRKWAALVAKFVLMRKKSNLTRFDAYLLLLDLSSATYDQELVSTVEKLIRTTLRVALGV